MEEIKCTIALMKMRDWLKEQIADEEQAYRNYYDRGNEMIDSDMSIFGLTLSSMASDEAKHAGFLQIIVDVITEKCNPITEKYPSKPFKARLD